MSNVNPTIGHIAEIVGNLNNTYSDKIFNLHKKDESIELFTIHSDGNVVIVYCLGVNVFNTEDDPRQILHTTKGYVRYEEGECAREDLYNFLMTEYRKIKELLINF